MSTHNQTNLSIGFLLFCTVILLNSCGPKWTESPNEGFNLLRNNGGQTLGYSPQSGVNILTVDRYAFKDLNKKRFALSKFSIYIYISIFIFLKFYIFEFSSL